jgi:hypothetical protein
MPKTDGEEESSGSSFDISKLASAAALDEAALAALQNALAIKSTEEEAAKDELQAEIDAGTAGDASASGDAGAADASAEGEVSTEAKE